VSPLTLPSTSKRPCLQGQVVAKVKEVLERKDHHDMV